MAIYYNLDLGFPDYDDIKNLHTFVGSVYFLFCKMCFYSHLTVEKTSAQRSQLPCLRLHKSRGKPGHQIQPCPSLEHLCTCHLVLPP
jgi:hypothetical protein